jgi:hypothetical protein
MGREKDHSTLQEFGERLVLKGSIDPSVAPIIQKANAKGWKIITVQGNIELCRATWFEGKMAGLEVKGYNPTNEDFRLLHKMEEQKKQRSAPDLILTGNDIAQDYNTRVLPFLQKSYDELRRQRMKLGITTTDIDRAYGINLPTGYARDVDERFDRAKGAFLRAVDSRDFFQSIAKQQVRVKFSYEDGVARFVVREDEKVSLLRDGRNREMSRKNY